MRPFLIQHVDALITTTLGLWLLIHSWRRRKRLQASPNKLVRALPILSVFVLIFGLIRFGLESQPAYVWQRISTNDQRASAEFPSPTTTEAVTNSTHGVLIKQFTVKCTVPQRDINLRLSYNEIPPEAADLTAEQRLQGLKNFFEQQGFVIISSVPDDHQGVPGYRIVIEKDQGKIRSVTRVAITPKAIYRAVATSTSGFHDDPVITRFVDSFSLE